MATIAENLQTLVDQKAAIKSALEEKGKAPTDKLGTYPDLIKELDNEEQISYVLATSDGTQRAYTQLTSKTPITLTATENDIRQNTSAITDVGYTEGTKDIPAYHSSTGSMIFQAGSSIEVKIHIYDYSKLQLTLAEYNTSISSSVKVTSSSIDDAVYEAGSTTKLADITIDADTQSIILGITADVKSVLRYFVMKEE